MEWIRPEYAELVAAMRAAEGAIGSEVRPLLRGFILTEPTSEED